MAMTISTSTSVSPRALARLRASDAEREPATDRLIGRSSGDRSAARGLLVMLPHLVGRAPAQMSSSLPSLPSGPELTTPYSSPVQMMR